MKNAPLNSFFHLNGRLWLLLLSLFGGFTAQAQWQAYTPVLADTVGVADLRIAPGNAQVAWGLAMKYAVEPTTYTFLPLDQLVLVRTADGGDTWVGGQVPMGPEPFVSNISPLSATTAWASGIDLDFVSHVVRTTDGGLTWTEELTDGFGGPSGYVNFVHFWDEQNGVAMGDPDESDTDPVPFFEIYTTSDGGQNWNRVPSANIPAPLDNEFGSSGQYVAQGNYVWFTTLDFTTFAAKRMFRSKDRGYTWEVLPGVEDHVNLFSFADSLHGLAAKRLNAAQVSLRYTADAGDTWTQLPIYPTAEMGSNYTLIPESNYILAVRRANNVTGPFRTMLSKDLGQTWIELGAGEHVGVVRFASPTVGYGGEWQTPGHATRMYKYAGDPLTGLLSGRPLQAQVALSPNPTTDVLNVQIESTDTGDFLLLLHDTQGRLLAERRVASGKHQLEVNELPVGTYFLTVSNAKGALTQPFLKH